MASLIDHVFLTVSNLERSIAFYTRVLAPMGITQTFHYKAENCHPKHPNIHGFARDNRYFFWLREGQVKSPAHLGFAAKNQGEVQACYEAALCEGGKPDEVFGGAPGERLYYSKGYYAASVLDLDGNELEFTYKSFQHPSPGTD